MNIREELRIAADETYQAFHCKLIPTKDPNTILGVRIPTLRRIALQIKNTPEADHFLKTLPHEFLDEYTLHGLLIAEGKDFDEVIEQTDRFLPFIDNWATCDTFSPKIFKKNRSRLLPHIRRWVGSEAVYTVRFGIEMLQTHFLDEDFFPEALEWVAAVRSEAYYVRMMQAWFFATALTKQYEETLPLIQAGLPDDWVQNKSIQKACESLRISDERKAFLKTYKK